MIMLKFRYFPFLLALMLCVPANAQEFAGLQSCNANQDCVLVSQSCDKACATVPVHKQYEALHLQNRVQKCGAGVENLPVCNMNPPLQAACINNRCTIGYAYQHNSHDGDYRNRGFQSEYSTAAAP